MFEQQSRSRSMDENTAGLPGADPRLLLATIVHDFNNFLTPIVTILEELQSQNVGTARQLRRIDAALFCAFRAKTLARQLLDFATPRKIESAAVDVSQLLRVPGADLGQCFAARFHASLGHCRRSCASLHRSKAHGAGVAQSCPQRP